LPPDTDPKALACYLMTLNSGLAVQARSGVGRAGTQFGAPRASPARHDDRVICRTAGLPWPAAASTFRRKGVVG
jgi:hypothetical protein